MRYTPELRVGLTLIVTLAVIFMGIQFFQGSPIFSGSYELFTRLENASGITPGSAVRMRGVNVGTVGDVRLEQETGIVRIDFEIHDGIQIPRTTTATISGISTFGSVTLSLLPGAEGGSNFAPGEEVPAAPSVDLFGAVSARVPSITARADTVLLTANLAAGEVYSLLNDPNSDLRLALVGLRQTTNALNALIRAQSASLERTLDNSEALTADLRAFTATNGDSLTLAVSRLNSVLGRLDRNMTTVESSVETFDSLLAGVAAGQGTLGLLLNDSTLYVRLDTTLTRVNGVVDDFQQHPGRYLKHIKLVDIF